MNKQKNEIKNKRWQISQMTVWRRSPVPRTTLQSVIVAICMAKQVLLVCGYSQIPVEPIHNPVFLLRPSVLPDSRDWCLKICSRKGQVCWTKCPRDWSKGTRSPIKHLKQHYFLRYTLAGKKMCVCIKKALDDITLQSIIFKETLLHVIINNSLMPCSITVLQRELQYSTVIQLVKPFPNW